MVILLKYRGWALAVVILVALSSVAFKISRSSIGARIRTKVAAFAERQNKRRNALLTSKGGTYHSQNGCRTITSKTIKRIVSLKTAKQRAAHACPICWDVK
jgi:hypothetical protein